MPNEVLTIEPWQRPHDEVVTALGGNSTEGLDSAEARERLIGYGPNQLTAVEPTQRWRKVAAQFSEPLVILLLFATSVSLAAWWIEGAETFPIDAVVIVVIVIANAILGLWQELRAEVAVAALQAMTETHSRVVRDGVSRSLPSSELVLGDLLFLAEGDAVGADARLLTAASLSLIEAPLTGESHATRKQTKRLGSVPIGDRTNMVFNGTAVAAGRGVAVVTATGMSTEMGKIASLLDSQEVQRTPLQQELDRLGKLLGLGVAVIAAIVVASIVVTSDVSTTSDFVEVLLIGVSLAVAAVPEGLPAILSIVLAMGVQRMVSANAVVKKLSSVETLGSASVICTDKTGTLTRNEMTITRVLTASGMADISGVGYTPVGQVLSEGEELTAGPLLDEVRMLLGGGSLANDAELQHTSEDTWEVMGDPTEVAFLVAEEKLGRADVRRKRFDRVDEIPFTSERKMMTTLNTDRENGAAELVVVSKGAPDVLLQRCSHERCGSGVDKLSQQRRRAVAAEVDQLAASALRTLAVAYRPLTLNDGPFDESLEHDLVLLGVVGIMDPARPEAKAAIAEAHSAGIRVVAITGDHPLTASRIAADLGLVPVGEVGLTGAELDGLSDDEFDSAVSETALFSRVAPEHKLRIVERLQAQGNIVAMTGDGVNDAPALRRANIGVAMGLTGTEVSKEAADMILADDDFATIVKGVREGRAIFSNISKFLRYLLASNMGEVLVVFLGIIGGGIIGLSDIDAKLAVPLLATQILWINLLTDTGLALALGVDPAVDDPMANSPRQLTERIVDRSMLGTIALTGVVLATAGLVALDLELKGGLLGGGGGIVSARTHVFTTLVLGNVFSAFNSRSPNASAFHNLFTNRLLWAALALTIALQVSVVHLGFLNNAFSTTPMSAGDWLICIFLASMVLWAEELRKFWSRSARG